ncbi:MAG: thioredoxin family protein [Planctomycetota bacterium]
MGDSMGSASVAATVVAGLVGFGAFAGAIATESRASASAETTVVATQSGARSADLVLVKWHADWCPKCRALNPVWESVSGDLAGGDVLFVHLDRTDDNDALQAEYMTSALGFGDQWDRYGRRTGVITLHDGETGKLLREFSPRDDADAIKSAIASAE